MGHLKRICLDAFRVAGTIQETCSSEMLGPATDSWEGLHLVHQIVRFAKMILRDRCNTSYDLASLFRGRRTTLDRWSEKMQQKVLVRGRQLCTPLSMAGSLAELLRFWCCQLWKLRKSRRIAAFLVLSSAKIEEVSQDCFVFKLAARQLDR